MIGAQHVGFLLAGLAGLASFLSPCVLPLVPPYLAYLGGRSLRAVPAGGTAPVSVAVRRDLLASGAAFVVGVTVTFVAFFYALRTVLAPVHRSAWLPVVSGLVVVVMALQVAGLIRIPVLMRTFKVSNTAPTRGGAIGGFLLGLSFASGWTPCIGATLGAVLSSALVQGATGRGMALVLVYCLGLGLPFLALALAVGSASPLVRRLNRHRRSIDLVSAAVLLTMGVLLVTNNMTSASVWFSHLVPGWVRDHVVL